MSRLTQKYDFDWRRIQFEDSVHIEYCITDICNKNCAACSHLAPLAKTPNFVDIKEFAKVAGIMHKLIPDAHTVWLTGGEPTLHPEFIRLLHILRELYPENHVGIYTNGMTLKAYENDPEFWNFIDKAAIVFAVTPYDISPQYFESLFGAHGCGNNLTIIKNGGRFVNLTNYAYGQPVSQEKYDKCGWERSKINIRNGRIYNCPMAEFADLFNAYFDENMIVSAEDYLTVNEKLTREQIETFRGPTPFCGHCDLSKRYTKIFKKASSEKSKSEWSEF